MDAYSNNMLELSIQIIRYVKALRMMLEDSGSKLAQVSATNFVFDLCMRCQARSAASSKK